MKNEQNQGVSRRSFIKRSTVAAIAATNMMMFTGLVNAQSILPSPADLLIPLIDKGNMLKCKVRKQKANIAYPNGTNALIFYCIADKSCSDEITCGKMYVLGADGNPKVENGQRVKEEVKWKCDEETTSLDDDYNEIKVPKMAVCLRFG